MKMNDKGLGVALLLGAILAIAIYIYLIVAVNPLLTLQATAIIAVGAICVILGWIGYTLITTPSPAPIEPVTPATTESQREPTA